MRIFLINLDRCGARLAHMSGQLRALGLPYERVPAVDGQNLPDESKGQGGNPLNAGQIGCFLSHQKVWELVARGPDSYAVVLEDDIYIASTFAMFARSVDWIPPDAGIVKLETMLTRITVDRTPLAAPAPHRLFRLRSFHPGTAAYVVSRDAAALLRAAYPQPVTVADGAVFGVEGPTRSIAIYQVDPAPCIQDRVRPASQQDPLLAPVIESNFVPAPVPRRIRLEVQRLASQLRTAVLAATGAQARRERRVVPFSM